MGSRATGVKETIARSNKRLTPKTAQLKIHLCLLLFLAAPAVARDIHYGAVADPAVLECDQQHWRGEVAAARLCYANLLRAEQPAATKAEAAWALNNLQQSNTWFREAVAAAPDDLRIGTDYRQAVIAAFKEPRNEYRLVLMREPGHFNAKWNLELCLRHMGAAEAAGTRTGIRRNARTIVRVR
mgnify:CR=1 FL=1